jgi:Tannase and feruloyl esterase
MKRSPETVFKSGHVWTPLSNALRKASSPEKIADFGYRAAHLTALLSKTVVKAYYAKTQEKAYFDACSDGGREALMEAQQARADHFSSRQGGIRERITWQTTVSIGALKLY